MARTPFKENTWADYAIADPTRANQQELAAAVRRAAKAANQRLLRLERAGATKGVYALTMYELVNRKRFKENTAKMTTNALRHEYKILEKFIKSKTSTIQGRNDSIIKRFNTASERGFTGTLEEFEVSIEKAFAKHQESLFSSDILYQSVIEGNVDIIDAAVEQYAADAENRAKATLFYLRRRQSRKRE